MTQLWMDGFDHYGGSVGNLLDGAWAEVNPLGRFTLTPPAAGARTGANVLGYNGPGTAVARRVLGTSVASLFAGFGFFTAGLTAFSNAQVPIAFKTAANALIAYLAVRPDGALEIRSNSGAILGVTSGPVIVSNSWQHIECGIVISGATGTFQLRVDEITVLNLTNLNFGTTNIGQVTFENFGFSDTTKMYIDDLIVRDNSGTTNNTFMGDLRIATLQPIANGVNQGWTPRTKVKLGVGIMNFQDTSRSEAVTFPDNAAFELGAGSFCIEMFVRFDNLLTTTQVASFFSKFRQSSDERSYRLYLNGPDVGANLVFETSANGTAGDVVEVHAFPFVPETDRWYHIAVARNGTSSKMFLDGQQIGITQTDSRTYHANAALVYVNSLQDTLTTALAGTGMDGWMDGVRLTKGAARYTANFVPPTAPLPTDVGGDSLYASVQLLLNFDSGPTVTDDSANTFTATFEGSPFVEFPDDALAFQTVDGLSPDDNDFVEAALVAATGTLTVTANPLNTETVTIGATTYTFQTVLVDVANNVLIGATASDSLDNLIAAVNAAAGAGTLYGTGTVQNTSASLVTLPADQVLATARTPGAAGNTVATTEALSNGSWGASTLSGGQDIPANSEFTVSGLPPEVTGIRSVAVINRSFKTDSGASELTASFVTSGGSADAGAAHPVTVNPTYYEDTFERDPSTLGALTPSTLTSARIRLNRTL